MSLYRKYNFASPELETGPKSAPSLGIQELGLACVAGACWFTFFTGHDRGTVEISLCFVYCTSLYTDVVPWGLYFITRTG